MSSLQRHQDPLVFCLRHPGTGKLYFKTDTEAQRDRYIVSMYTCKYTVCLHVVWYGCMCGVYTYMYVNLLCGLHFQCTLYIHIQRLRETEPEYVVNMLGLLVCIHFNFTILCICIHYTTLHTHTHTHTHRWLEVLEKAVKGEIGSHQDQQSSHTPFRASSPQPDNDTSP